jgi:hypothetical protein
MTGQQGSFERQVALEYMKAFKDSPVHRTSHSLDKSDVMLANLVTQGMYNLAILGMRIKEECLKQSTSSGSG